MASNADRIRRVLSDGAPSPPARTPSPPRLREVPAQAAGGDAPPVPSEAKTLDEDLRRRLEALGVHTAGSRPLRDPRRASPAEREDESEGRLPADLAPPAADPDAPPSAGPGAASAENGADGGLASVERLTGAVERDTPHGRFVQVERRIPLAQRHGQVALEAALAHAIPLRSHERGPGGDALLDARRAVFIDTETSGLAGGTGTVAFLVGAGWIEDRTLVVRQYFMRDYPEEGALLRALYDDLGDSALVSFNGRSFDWPLLVTRWHMHRQRPRPRTHLDLLPVARRLWGCTLHSHSLATLERHVLGLERGEDLGGSLIPHAWFEYLRTGRGGTLARAFRHNEIDVVSMLALFARVGAILADPVASDAAPGDRLGTARLLLDLQEPDRARRCLEAGLSRADEGEERPLRRMLGHMVRREGDWPAALAHWQAVARGPGFDPEAHEQVAKLYEHRLRDLPAALRWTEEALARTSPGSRLQGAFQHRAARLRRKLERAGGPA